MFNNERYITRGIASDISEHIQLALWSFIEILKLDKNIKVDYLQVFKLRKAEGNNYNLIITHSQEEPDYKKVYFVKTDDSVDAKIFVIDDGDHSTMMIASEY